MTWCIRWAVLKGKVTCLFHIATLNIQEPAAADADGVLSQLLLLLLLMVLLLGHSGHNLTLFEPASLLPAAASYGCVSTLRMSSTASEAAMCR